MVTPADLLSWEPDSLATVADEVATCRRTLTGLGADLDAGRPPASWTLADGDAARTTHQNLVDTFTTQVSESTGVVDALDTAVTTIRAAKTLLEGALERAGKHGLQVDRSTGAVSIVKSFDNQDDAADAAVVQAEVAEQISTALRDAGTADTDLAAALTTASTTDVNTVGSLAEQQAIAAFDDLTPSQQVQYLLDHPGEYDLLDDHVSDAVQAQVGERIADGLDGLSRDTQGLTDPAMVEKYTALLDAFGEDPDVMGPLYERLGPDGLLGTLNGVNEMLYLGVDHDSLSRLADELRAGLGTASTDPDFDGEKFGQDLVRYATRTVGDDQMDAFEDVYRSGSHPSSVLDYLLRGGDYRDDFVKGVTWQLDDFERSGVDGSEWSRFNGMSAFDGLDPAINGQPDPMAAAMGQLAKHPELGLDFFTEDTERQDFYFQERDWSRDGFSGISQAALAIGTDETNLAEHGKDTGMFVSGFFDGISKNPEFTAEHAGAASEPIADLLKHYMPAVQAATGDGVEGEDFPAQVRTLDDQPYLPYVEFYPELDQGDLNRLLDVALSSEDGLARMAEGVAGYRQTVLSGVAQVYGTAAAAGANEEITRLLGNAASVEGFLQQRVGEIAIAGAESKDQQVAAFTGLVSEAAGLIPVPYADEAGDMLGKTGTKLWESAWGHVQEIPSDRITEVFGSHADAETQAQSEAAERGQRDMVINSYLSLVHAGLLDVPVDRLDVWAPDGELVSLATIRPEDLQYYRGQAELAMKGAISAQDLDSIYRLEFGKWF